MPSRSLPITPLMPHPDDVLRGILLSAACKGHPPIEIEAAMSFHDALRTLHDKDVTAAVVYSNDMSEVGLCITTHTSCRARSARQSPRSGPRHVVPLQIERLWK